LALAADNVKFNEPGERDDIELLPRCGIKEGGTKPSADVRITNDSSRRSSYIVVIDINDSGSQGIALNPLGPVDPGESKVFTIEASGNATSFDAPFTCEINSVNRIAAE
jgi:hypothetical protein